MLKNRKNIEWKRKQPTDLNQNDIERIIDEKLRNYVSYNQFQWFKDEVREAHTEIIQKLYDIENNNYGSKFASNLDLSMFTERL